MPSTNYIHGISMDKAFSGATARLLHKINDSVICLSAKCVKVPVFGGIEKGGPVAAVSYLGASFRCHMGLDDTMQPLSFSWYCGCIAEDLADGIGITWRVIAVPSNLRFLVLACWGAHARAGFL